MLMLLAQDTVDLSHEWFPSHEEQLQQVRHHEIVVLDGGHYLHWTRSPEIAAATTAFLDKHGVSPRGGAGLPATATAG